MDQPVETDEDDEHHHDHEERDEGPVERVVPLAPLAEATLDIRPPELELQAPLLEAGAILQEREADPPDSRLKAGLVVQLEVGPPLHTLIMRVGRLVFTILLQVHRGSLHPPRREAVTIYSAFQHFFQAPYRFSSHFWILGGQGIFPSRSCNKRAHNAPVKIIWAA